MAYKRYQFWYEFTETEEQAKAICSRINATLSKYMRTKHPAHYTPWQSSSKTDKAHFVVWYYRG